MTTQMRAMFTLDSITIEQRYRRFKRQGEFVSEPYDSHTLRFQAVSAYDDAEDSERRKFWEATPSGEFVVECANPETVKRLKVGTTYYVDFTEAPAEAQ